MKATLWFSFATTLVMFGIAAIFWSYRQMDEAAALRMHTYFVLRDANDLLSEIKDAETGQRGFLLTGDEAFLQPYLAVRDGIEGRLASLRKLTTIEAGQKHLDAMKPLVAAKLNEIKRVVELNRKHDMAGALAIVNSGEGKVLMDSIRAEIKSFIKIEEESRQAHDQSFQSSMLRLFTLIVIASSLTLLFAMMFAYLFYRQAHQSIKDALHLQTQRSLDIQEDANIRLQDAYFKLQESEEKLGVTLNSISDAVVATDADGKVTYLNPKAEKLTGWTYKEIIGLPIEDILQIINQETRLPSVIPIKDTLTKGTVHGLADKSILVARNGSERSIADSCAPIRARDGEVVGAVMVFRDVTDEYASQQAMHDNASLIQTILNTVLDGIITLRASDSIIETVNPAAERMFGYSAAELIGQNFTLLIPDLETSRRTEMFEKLKSGNDGSDVNIGSDAPGRRKDGSSFPMEISLSQMWLSGERHFTAILRDNTARKQAAEALIKAGGLQSAIFNSENFSSIATDAKGVIQIFNVGAEHMLGYTAADVMNKNTPADISDPQELIARAGELSAELGTPITPGFEAMVFKAKRGIEDIYELTYIRKDGSRFPAVVSVTALRDAQNDIIGYLLIGTDNTARKKAEEALLQAGALQSAIFNSENFSSIATDAKGVIQIFNVGAERMLGYTAAEVMNKITPADISDPNELIARATELSEELGTTITPGFEALVFKASRGIEDIYEMTSIRKDGSRIPVVLSVTALRDDQDSIIGYLLIGTDNTARKRAEEDLLQAGALQSAIFNSENFSSIATDARGVIQIFNVGAEHMLGYTAAEVMNTITPADISDPGELIARAETLSSELGTPISPGFEAMVFKAKRGIEDIYELTYIRKDGSRFPAIVSVTALRDEQNSIIGYLLIGTDNTARKQVEAEQEQLAQRLRDHQFYTRSLFESNIDAIMTTDPSGIITDVNNQMETLTDSTRDELIGAPFKNYFTDPDQAEAGIKLVLTKKHVTNYELTARTRGGKETVVSFNATTFYDRDRKLQGVFAAARDITAQKLLDQELLEKNAELEVARLVAEKANLAKSDFLSSMSHELRSPLNAILGFAQLMESDSPTASSAQKESVAQILQAGWHLLKLINEILDLAKVESRQVPLSEETVSLSEVMRECQGMVEPQLQKREIQLKLPKFDIPYFVNADRTRLKQVLINLLTNAIKYNSKQGMVEVKIETRTIGRVRVMIRDTGAGLSTDKLAQLFQPFNRLGQEASGEEGTGIGLVVAKRLVELMGGTIGVESQVGIGSVFWFELASVDEPLPDIEGKIGTADTTQLVHRLDKEHKLLYIEDNPANLRLVEQIISRHPELHLQTAVNGTEGIEIARKTLPDAILMDINLPGISGFDALEILHADPLTSHIPIIAVSANAMQLDIEKGIKAGFFRYMTKPIKVDELMEALDGAFLQADRHAEIAGIET